MEYNDIVKYWKKQNIQTADELRDILNGHIINFAYHSGKIENPNTSYDDTREIFENDSVCNYTGDLRTLYEIRNAKDSINMILDSFGKKPYLTEEFIKKTQYELTKNTYDQRRWNRGERPGDYKKHDYIVGEKEVGASAEDTPYEMAELIEDIRDTNITSENVLKAAAYFHCKMENIHPFSDGNGRTGRLLVNHLLINYNNPPMIIYNEDKKQYFNALRAWDERQSISEMVSFIQEQVIKTWHKQVLKNLIIPKKYVKTTNDNIFRTKYNYALYTYKNEERAAVLASKEVIKKGCNSAEVMELMCKLLPKANTDNMYPIEIINKVKEDKNIAKVLSKRDQIKETGLQL